MIKIDLSHALCRFEDWRDCLPEEERGYSQQVWMNRSRRGDWPYFHKSMNERSPALWAKRDISEAFLRNWGVSHPSSYQALLDKGFPEAKAIMRKSRRLPGGKKKRQDRLEQ